MAVVYETLEMPYYRAIPLGLRTGSVMRLDGFIPQQSKGFNVDFVCGQYIGADVPLKFRIRFEGPPPSTSAIVTLNSRRDRRWGKEETALSTLRQGQHFHMRFTVTSTGYKITENNRVLWEMPHRIPPEYVRALEMDGEVTLSTLALN